MKYLYAFACIAIGIVAFIEGMIAMKQFGGTNVAGSAIVAMIIGVVAFAAGVRAMTAR